MLRAVLAAAVMAGLFLARAALAQASSPVTQPATAPAAGMLALPYITIDRAHHWVDIQAKVCGRDADWLELLLCTPNTREYESVLVTKAKPSQVELALLILGLQSGAPVRIQWAGQVSRELPARGPRINVSLIYRKEGKKVEVPATHWLRDQKAKRPATPQTWIFAGSGFTNVNGKRAFAADLSGNLITLVNFGDDVLVLPHSLSNYNGEFPWGPNTPAIPPVGTPVIVRLSPAVVPAGPSATTRPACAR